MNTRLSKSGCTPRCVFIGSKIKKISPIGSKIKKQSHKFQIFSIGQKTKLAESRFEAITGSKFRIDSYPLVASSQHIGAAAAVTILQLEFMLVEQ